jgi:hypothetical protein
MAVFLVTYDLIAPGKVYSTLITRIEQYDHAKIAYSAYAVSTPLTAQEFITDLELYADGNDRIFVAQLNGSWVVNNQIPGTSDWLYQHALG